LLRAFDALVAKKSRSVYVERPAMSKHKARRMAPAGPRNETEEHWLLKRLALGWAYHQGFNCISFEVCAPRSPYRVDVAGYRPAKDQESPIVALFECKQNRPDLARDSAQTASIEIELRGLQERRQNLERLLAVHYPNARTPSSLFPDWDPFDPEKLPHTGYRRLMRRIVALQRKLEGNTKFERVTRYRLANLHFLVAPAGLVQSERVPPGWGLLEEIDNARLELSIQPRFYSITNEFAWLERICKNSTIRWLKTVGAVELGQDEAPKLKVPENLARVLSDLGKEVSPSSVGRAKTSARRDFRPTGAGWPPHPLLSAIRAAPLPAPQSVTAPSEADFT
jgi:hypothetical protein